MARIFKNTEQGKFLIGKLSLIFPNFNSIRKMVTSLNAHLSNTQLREIQ